MLQRDRAQAALAIQTQQLRKRPAAKAAVGVVENRSGFHSGPIGHGLVLVR
jgi:hypothetical protein